MTFHATKSDRELLCNFTGIVRRSGLGVRCLAFAVKMAKVQAIRLEDFASAVKAKRAEESLARGHGGQGSMRRGCFGSAPLVSKTLATFSLNQTLIND